MSRKVMCSSVFLICCELHILANFLLRAPAIKAPVKSNKKCGRAPVKYDSDDGEPVSGFEDDSPKEHRKKPKIV